MSQQINNFFDFKEGEVVVLLYNMDWDDNHIVVPAGTKFRVGSVLINGEVQIFLTLSGTEFIVDSRLIVKEAYYNDIKTKIMREIARTIERL
jgi:hypothetical protein